MVYQVRQIGNVIYSGSATGMSLTIIIDCDPLVVLEEAARKFDSAKHHPNCVRVQFVQIGDDHGAKEALERLTKGNVRASSFSTLHILRTTY